MLIYFILRKYVLNLACLITCILLHRIFFLSVSSVFIFLIFFIMFLFLILTVDVRIENAEGHLLVSDIRISILIASFIFYFLWLLLSSCDLAIFNILNLSGSATIFFSTPFKLSQSN